MADERDVQLSITATSPSGCWSGAPRWDESQGEQLSLLQGLWHPLGRGLKVHFARGTRALLSPKSCRDRQGARGQSASRGHGGLQQLRAGWGLLIFHPRWVTGRGRKCRNPRWKGHESFQEAAVGRPEPGACAGGDTSPGSGPSPSLAIPPFPSEVPEEEQASLEQINIAVNKQTGRVL